MRGGLAEPMLAALAAEAEEIRGRPSQHLLAAEASQFDGHAADFVELVAIGIEEKQRIAGFFE